MTRSPSPLLALHSSGAVTNIGNSVAQTLASWVTQVRRTRRIAIPGFADPFTVADCATVTEGKCGPERLRPLLKSAMAEARESSVPPAQQGQSFNILVLPSWLDEATRTQLAQSVTSLWPTANAPCQVLQSDSVTAAWQALEYAYKALAQQPQIQQVVIATVDSLCEPALLRAAAEAGWLLQTGNSQGFIAGEGAACVVLNRVHDITKVPPGQFAVHRPTWLKHSHRWWPASQLADATPMARVVQTALSNADLNGTHISHLLSDMDGSDWRALIESDALGRSVFMETGPLPHWQPATLIGQTGLATGLLDWILPAAAHAKGINYLNTVLNWSLDPAGLTAACVLERSPH